MSETKQTKTTSTSTNNNNPTNISTKTTATTTPQKVVNVAAAATGAAATSGWVTTGLKDFSSRIRQEFIGANLYLIGFLIVLFLGIAFYVYNYYISPLFSKGYVANKEISKNGIDGVGRDEDDPWNLADDDGAAFDFSLLDKGLKFKNIHLGNIKNGLLLVNREDKIYEPKYTKLQVVVNNNDKDSVVKVLEKLPKKEINTEVNGWTALDLALTLKQQRETDRSPMSTKEIKANNEIKQLLIDAGGEPNISLHWMAKEGDVNQMEQSVKILNDNDIPLDINNELPNEWTPLDVAMEVEIQSGPENFANMREGMTNKSMSEYIKTLNGTNNATHEKTKISSKGSLVVNFFYTVWCPYSKKAEPHFNKLMKKYNGTGTLINGYEINCVKINGESEATLQKQFEETYLKNSKGKQEIDGYPTIYLVKNDKDSATGEVYEFEAQPQFNVFEDFIRQVAFGYAG